MRFKDYMEIGNTAPAGQPNVPGQQPAQQPVAPGTIQNGQQQQQKLPPGTENQEWYKEIMKSRMSPVWQQHFINQQMSGQTASPSTGAQMVKSFGNQAMNQMMGTPQ